jgi:hypothetical protein
MSWRSELLILVWGNMKIVRGILSSHFKDLLRAVGGKVTLAD